MGLITNLVQMKSQRDFDQKALAMQGFMSVMGNPNASPEMKEWAQQGYLDVAAPAIAGDGKGAGGKKQEGGVRHILGSLLGGVANVATAGGFGRMKQADAQSKAAQQQLQGAMARPQPVKKFLSQEEIDQIKQRQETAAAQIREQMAVQQARDVEAAKSAQARADDQKAYEDRVKRADALFGSADTSTARKEYILTGKLPNAPGFKNVPGLTVGSDPRVKDFADANGLTIDPAKSYRLQEDSEGNVVSVMEAGSAPQQQRMYGAVQGYYYDGIAQGLNDADAKKYAGRMFAQAQGVHLGRVEQQAAVDAALSGIGLGGGLNRGAAMRGLGQSGQSGGSPEVQASPAAAPAAAPAKPKLTPKSATGPQPPKPPDLQASRQMDMYYSSILGNTPPPSSGPDKVGYVKGREAVEKLTGLSAVDFELAARTAKDLAGAQKDNVDRYVAMERLQSAMDLMGPNVESLAKKALQTGSPFLNRHIRDLKQQAIGDPDIKQLMVAVNDFQRQYAVLTAGGALSRAQLPVETQKNVEKIIDPDQTLEVVAASVEQIRKQAKLETEGFRNAIDKTSKEIKDRLSGKKPGDTTGSGGGGRGGSSPTPNAQDYLKKWGITGGGGR